MLFEKYMKEYDMLELERSKKVIYQIVSDIMKKRTNGKMIAKSVCMQKNVRSCMKKEEKKTMNKRSTKFYRKNEAEVMKRLGLYPTRNSGAGWIEKCDGQNELFICELKSTDKESYTLKQKTLQELEYHACVAHKIPVFALQFLNRDEVWVAITEDEFKEYMEFKKKKQEEQEIDSFVDSFLDSFVDKEEKERYNIYMPSRKVGRSYLARQSYMEQKARERKENEQRFKENMKERNRERRKQQIGKEI